MSKTTKASRTIERDGYTMELRVKGNWKFFHLYWPVIVFIWHHICKLFNLEEKFKEKFYNDYYTVVRNIFFNRKKATCYLPVHRTDLSMSPVAVDHEFHHVKHSNQLLKILSASYRLDDELEAYEYQIRKVVREKGYFPASEVRELARKLYTMYVLQPFTSYDEVFKRTYRTVRRVEKEMR